MEPDFWRARWAENKTAFHEGRANTFLAAHHTQLRGRVLVPLCGKAEDLAFLAAQGHEVVGVELVETAVAAFFADHGLTPAIDTVGEHRVYRAGAITLIAGDWFGVTRELVGHVDSIYDRAAQVALPEAMRQRYRDHLRALTGDGTPGLLVAIDYPADQFAGPPFPLVHAEVRASYASVTILAEEPADGRCGDANIGAINRCYATVL